MVLDVEFFLEKPPYVTRVPRLADTEAVEEFLAFFLVEFRRSAATVVGGERVGAAVVPPIRPPTSGRRGLPDAGCRLGYRIAFIWVFDEYEPSYHLHVVCHNQ